MKNEHPGSDAHRQLISVAETKTRLEPVPAPRYLFQAGTPRGKAAPFPGSRSSGVV